MKSSTARRRRSSTITLGAIVVLAALLPALAVPAATVIPDS
ncbi:hypothetical protein [Cellulosimicrobium sp. NPDC057127]